VLRKHIGMAQQALANVLGVSAVTLRRWEQKGEEIDAAAYRWFHVFYAEWHRRPVDC
jgi:DNA-binding transcriptional regulator YiaG